MIHRELNTIFVHMPRCAGTAIRQRLNEVEGAGDNTYYSHITAYDYKLMLGEEVYKKFFKFSAIRNPFDRVYSSFKRKSTIDGHTYTDFEKWLVRLTEMDWKLKGVRGVLASHFYWLGDPSEMDFIIRYEDFANGWDYVCERLGIANYLKVVNVGEYHPGGYKKYHTKKTIEIVEKYFEKDLKEFDYAY